MFPSKIIKHGWGICMENGSGIVGESSSIIYT
jgi:hypothetical protein